MFPHVPDAAPIHSLQDQARREARRLRRQAMNDFGKDAGTLCRQGLAAVHDRTQYIVARFNILARKV